VGDLLQRRAWWGRRRGAGVRAGGTAPDFFGAKARALDLENFRIKLYRRLKRKLIHFSALQDAWLYYHLQTEKEQVTLTLTKMFEIIVWPIYTYKPQK
jgi:hypothetical protein